MAKKQFTCRINTESYNFLENFSKEVGINHPAFKTMPNISKSLDIVIGLMADIKNNNIPNCDWNSLTERVNHE